MFPEKHIRLLAEDAFIDKILLKAPAQHKQIVNHAQILYQMAFLLDHRHPVRRAAAARIAVHNTAVIPHGPKGNRVIMAD